MAALDWNGNIEAPEPLPEFVLIPEGEHQFTITGIEKGEHLAKPGGKIGNCPKVEVSIKIECKEGISVLKESLFLDSACMNLLSAFFASIGIMERMQWDLEGRTGWCYVGHREYNGKTYATVKRWLPAASRPKVWPPQGENIAKSTMPEQQAEVPF